MQDDNELNNGYDDEKKINYMVKNYDSGVVAIRMKLMPLVIMNGGYIWSYYVLPAGDDEEFINWWDDVFPDIIKKICKDKNMILASNQKRPSYNKIGWYLPLSMIIEIIKVWNSENVPFYTGEIFRPPEKVYGKIEHLIRRVWELERKVTKLLLERNE